MKKTHTLKGFSFFETILYIALFSVLATALLNFSWDTLDLGSKDRVSRIVFSDARFVASRIGFLIRNASGIDTGASVFGDADGRLVLEQLGSGDTVTIALDNGNITIEETGSPAVTLNTSDSRASALTFLDYGSVADGSEYVSFTFSLESVGNDTVPATHQAETTIVGGASIRNSGL